MFFIKYLERDISIHPSFFGRGVSERLRLQLYADMEGTCNGEYYIICIMDITNISPGTVKPNRGEANFNIQYRAIVWKPFKGEVVQIVARPGVRTGLLMSVQIDCAVMNVKEQGLFCEAGPLLVFVAQAVSVSLAEHEAVLTEDSTFPPT
jgi:DNA-directed RNA polymerase II subunit RPB7